MTEKIVRVWRATAGSGAAAYEDHFRHHVLPSLAGVPGYLSAVLLRSDAPGGETDFLVITEWQDLVSIRRFAGDDPEQAVVAEEAAVALLDFDDRVRHYCIAASSEAETA